MKNRSWIAWVIIGILLAIAIGFWLLANAQKNINWTEHYKSDSKDPYGTYLLKELVKYKYADDFTDITKTIDKDLPADVVNANYIYIGNYFNTLTNHEQKSLFEFVERGNNAFISSTQLPYSMGYLLKNGGTFSFDSVDYTISYPDSVTGNTPAATSTEFEEHIDETIGEESSEETETEEYTNEEGIATVTDTLFEEDYADADVYEDDTLITTDYVDSAVASVDTIAAIALQQEDSIRNSYITHLAAVEDNYIVPQLKKPLPNTPGNYSFEVPKQASFLALKPYSRVSIPVSEKLDSSVAVFSMLNDHTYNYVRIPYGKGYLYVFTTPILLTNYFVKEKQGLSHAEEILSVLSNGKLFWDEVPAINRQESESSRPRTPYLKYVLAVEPLRWAWYLLLATVLIYILFESKRKQRIIPVIEPVNNTSIEYVQTTGRLYAQIGNHRKLIQLNMRLFISTIQQKYGVKINLDNPASVQWLATKSGIEAQRFIQLQEEYKRITLPGHEMKTKDLHLFYQQLQFIYKKIQN
ncbi:MAG: hypothetical protein ACTHJT_08425 [Cytophaga sp.]|uniref:hypothetical protein n=1 Tax=Cytophaga sp. TaxID=29535 RepID=UPI003F812D13